MQLYILYRYGQRIYVSSNLFDIYLAIPYAENSFYDMDEKLTNQGHYEHKEYTATVRDYQF